MSSPAATPEHEEGLLRQLSARQMAMVAVGGSIGTGLLLGSGEAIRIAGPAVILTFILGGAIMWTVTVALGEMASLHPAAGSFGVYAELYLNPWAGFIARYGYWYAMVISIGAEMLASATYMRLWAPALPEAVWVALFGAALIVVNLWSVGHYGEFEYWFAILKVIVIAAFIVIGAALLAGHRVAQQYTPSGGFAPHGWLAPLLATGFAIFTFGGVEMVAISSGEARSANEVARATRWMFAILAFVYVGATAVLVGVMPWNQSGVAESPFVSVLRMVGLPAAEHVMNFVVLTAALSGANASLYVASRMIFSLARTGYAPAALGRLNRAGSPVRAIAVSSGGIAVAILLAHKLPESAYLYMFGGAYFGGALAWLVSLAAHIGFRRKITREELARLPFRAPGGAVTSAIGFIAMAIATILTWWTSLNMSIKAGGPLLLVLTIGYFAAARERKSTA
jgi:amino acid transporter, AAT family